MTQYCLIAQRLPHLLLALSLLALCSLASTSARAELLVPTQCIAAQGEENSESEGEGEGEAEVEVDSILEEEPECD